MNGSSAVLTDLDDDFASALKRKPVATLPQLDLPNGRFTLVFPCGTHKTLRVHTQQLGKMAGKRIVSLLIGPENSTDYQQFGELVDSPVGFWAWKNWKGKKPEEYAGLLVKMLRGEVIEGYEVLESRNCLRCNLPLTTPESIAANLGPRCMKPVWSRNGKA